MRTPAEAVRAPYVTYGLIAANALVFALELIVGSEAYLFMLRWGVVPHSLTAWIFGSGSPAALVTPITSLFVHAGWVHLLSNMLYLWFFGTRLEGGLGAPRLLGLYVVAGVAATLAQALAMMGSYQPILGASGAVAGVLGACLVLYPTGIFGLFRPRWLAPRTRGAEDVGAVLLLGLWVLSQAFSGALSVVDAPGSDAPAAHATWWAHATGFALGAGVAGWVRVHRRSVSA